MTQHCVAHNLLSYIIYIASVNDSSCSLRVVVRLGKEFRNSFN